MTGFFNYEGTPPEDQFLGKWSELDWRKFTEFVRIQRFSKGDVLVQKGDLSRELLILTRGSIVVDIPQSEATGVNLSITIQAGNIVGEQAFIDGLPRSQSLVAGDDGEMMVVTYQNFESLIAREPQLGREFIVDVARILSKRLRNTTERAMTGE